MEKDGRRDFDADYGVEKYKGKHTIKTVIGLKNAWRDNEETRAVNVFKQYSLLIKKCCLLLLSP